MHNLSAGGSFDIVAKGFLHTASADSNAISSTIPFTSNVLTATIDGAAASKVRRDFHEHAKRSIIQLDCSSDKRTSSITALRNCADLANAALIAALANFEAPLKAYFKDTSTATRNAVVAVYSAAAAECASSTSGAAREHCVDLYGACVPHVLAYAAISETTGESWIVNCPLFFTLPALTSTCHGQDQAMATLHETTHLKQIKGTTDHVYGDEAVKKLSAAQALENADTFGYFANGKNPFIVGCSCGMLICFSYPLWVQLRARRIDRRMWWKWLDGVSDCFSRSFACIFVLQL